MKKILLLLFLVNSTLLFSQEDVFGGTPADGIIPIKRLETSNNLEYTNKTTNQNLIPQPSTPTGNSAEVGATEGQLSVSLTGGANYNIPIAVPPGINGIVPQISLSYNSQGGNGLAGYGWNVSGVSVITRTSSTKFHDDIIDGVDFNSLDRFAFDGKRLIVKNGTSGVYGANGTVYETESFSNVLITSYGVHPSGASYGPAYFIVQYPDGSSAQYGNSSNSRSITDWAITYWQNPQGVRISYNYILSNNNLSISTIKYGTRLTTTPINEISFVYKTRQRPEQAYIGGQSFIRNTILSEIKVKGNNIGFRNYILTHETTSLGYERLKNIVEKSGDYSKSFNPTVFNYDTTTNSNIFNPVNLISLNLNLINSVNYGFINSDFNGDGKTDFILYPTVGNYAKSRCWLFTNVEGSSNNNGIEHNLGLFTHIFPTSLLNSNEKLIPMQGWCSVHINSNITSFKNYSLVPQDPSTGLNYSIELQYTRTYQSPIFNYGYWKYPCTNTINKDNNGEHSESLIPIDPDNNDPVWTVINKVIPKEYLSGDFNGDGLTDVIIIEKPFSFQYAQNCSTLTYTSYGGKSYFLDLDSRIVSDYVNVAGFLQITLNSKFVVADVNGDGKSDLLVFDSGIIKVYHLNENKQLELFINQSEINILSNMPNFMGDFNGDGKVDFVIPQAENYDAWCFFLSKGNGFQKVCTSIGRSFRNSRLEWVGYPLSNQYLVEYNFITSDFNNDGKTDILCQENFTLHQSGDWVHGFTFSHDLNPASTKFVLLENKKVDNSQILFNVINTPAQDVGISRFPIPMFVDINNTNKNNSFEYGLLSGNKIKTFKITKDAKVDTELKEIVLGNGVKEVITYSPLDYEDYSNENIFEPSTYTENYPNFDIKVANGFKVVSKLEQVSASHYKKQKFKYYGAVTNLKGLGFLGFRGLLRTNWFNDDNPVISSISKHDISKRGAITETFSIIGEPYGNFTSYSPSSFINKTTMTYEDELLTNKVFKIKNLFTRSINGLDATSKEINTTYDNYNNPLITTSISKNGTNVEKTETVNVEYYPAVSSPIYYVGRLKKKNSSVSHNGDTMTGEEIYTYNSAHLVSKIQKKGHLTNYLTEDNIYDVFGNITKKTITASGLTPRITNFTYEPTGRFLLSSIDIESLTTSYAYNTSNGLLLSQTLPSNAGYPLTTTFLYDIWGKRIKETDYLGKNLNTTYNWLNISTNGYFEITSLGDDDSKNIVRFDDLGRKIAEGVKTLNDNSSQSNLSWKTFEYDINDRVKKSYEPLFSAQPQWTGLYNSSSFDIYGRLIQNIEHTGKTTTISYNGLTTIASDGVSNTTSIKNSLGNVVSMTDNGGTITYQHFANSNLKESNFNGVKVVIEQDGWGRKTKLTDPSAGIYQYEYNEFGETTKEITPKGITTYTLDNFGKVTQKTIIGTAGDPTNTKTVYTYNATSKLLTNTRYDDFSGGLYTLYSYGYDNYKRLIFNDESGFNAYYQRAIQFDSFGRSEKELYTAINSSNFKQSSKWIRNTYKNGHHWQILDDSSNEILWQINTINARGQLTSANLGNGIAINNSYNNYGYISHSIHSNSTTPFNTLMTLSTTFEAQRGNLTSRYNSMFDHQENFTYDNLDRLTSWSDFVLMSTFTFTNSTDNFLPSSSGAVVSNVTNLISSKLNVVVNTNLEGTQRLIESNAQIGKVYEFSGSLFFGTKNTLSENFVKYIVVERNPINGLTIETDHGYAFSNNTFSFQHTVSQYPEVYLKIVAGNDFTLQAPTNFSLDDIKVKVVLTNSQTYDNLGRIDENNVGTYNYTNVNAGNSVPKHFQNSSIDTNPDYTNYYLSRANLDITYNSFKSPINIIEEGKDKLSFIYNMNNSRSTMYYGGLQADKLARPLRRHYSADGSMEIKQNIATGETEFITYIGGDAYSAPVVLKSDGTTQNYLYLHRDYLGSIVAISNQLGAVIEKRLFDAWGNITKIDDGEGNVLTKLTVLDRGYTGHEHLQGVNLIHMNGRLYDPVIHRFLQPDNFVSDPFNTQAFNRYGYVLNNPLKYSDPSGEFPWTPILIGAIIGAVSGGAAYVAYAIQTGDWSWSGFGMAVGGGALIGGITGGISPMSIFSAGGYGQIVISSFASGFMPPISVPIGDWTISASPALAFGNAEGLGVSFGVTYSDGDFSVSGGFGVMEYTNYNGFGANAREFRYSALINYDDGKTGFSLGTNIWRGDFKQQTGVLGLHSGDVNFTYENDGIPFGLLNKKGEHKWYSPRLGDGQDRNRSAAASLSIGEYSARFNIFTGDRDYKGEVNGSVGGGDKLRDGNNVLFPRNYVNEVGKPYRLGALSVGYKGYHLGINSERHVSYPIQARFAHGILPQGGFPIIDHSTYGYFQYRTPNIFTSW